MNAATDTMSMAVIADDLTGAADTGVQFCPAAGPVYLTGLSDGGIELTPEAAQAGGIAIYTNSRHLSPGEAGARVEHVLAWLQRSRLTAELIYKKIDSCLRGNLGAELDALVMSTGADCCFVAPALPAQGRTTEHDIHKLRGIPVADTELSRDPLCPVRESRLSACLKIQSGLGVGHVDLATLEKGGVSAAAEIRGMIAAGCRLIAFDAIDERHLDAIAGLGTMALQDREILFCGSAGLAMSLSRIAAAARTQGYRPAIARQTMAGKQPPSWLMVCGSASETAGRQVARLAQSAGWKHAALDPDQLTATGNKGIPGCPFERSTGTAPQAGNHLLSISRAEGRPPVDPLCLMERFAAVAATCVTAIRPEALFLTGGDTAEAVLKHIGCKAILLHREVLPGLVQGSLCGGSLGGATVVTKAGAFGREDTLERLVRQFSPT
ncbi:MAG: four-carbon acid sugar kinase family protein [Desulfofustis sp.]|jgi:uncharacterized protein YgbK (DUF1537 family)|nr:four-carbon acid sugar kinase family protein [Desulfofustis sp.]